MEERIVEKLDDHENRIGNLEVFRAEQEIKSALRDKDFEYMKKSADKTEATTERIERALAEHIQAPAKELNRLTWSIISFIVLAVVGYFIRFK